MRKDKLSSFQAKKQKLLKIKEIIKDQKDEYMEENEKWVKIDFQRMVNDIWEIVKDE